MNIFGFRPFKGKFNLGDADDIPTNQDGTLIGSIKQIKSDLVEDLPVESDASSSANAYTTGEHFLLNGQYCVATDDIQIGDALVENTNYEEDSMGNAIEHIEKTLPTLSTPIFIDTSNIIYSGNLGSGYTATENCYVGGGIYVPDSGATVKLLIDNVAIGTMMGMNAGNNYHYYPFGLYLKKGQKLTQSGSASTQTIKVLGLKK